MSEFKLSYRYAKSLIELAESQGSLDAVHNDMGLFLSCTRESKEFSNLLKKPIVKPSNKLKILEALFSSKVSDLTMGFFTLITKKGRDYFLEGIASEYQRQWKIKKGIVDAHLVTAIPLSDDLQEKIRKLVNDQISGDVEIHASEDKSVIGGFSLRVGDRQVDETIKTKLGRLKRDLA